MLQAVAQGNVDDSPSLVKAPNSGRARAGVGVAETEYPPPVHALWKLEDGVINSQVATQGALGDLLRLTVCKDDIVRFAAG